MSAAAEEAREKIERIVALTPSALLLLSVLCKAFVTVLIVDAARGWVREGIVGVGYGDKFLLCSFVASARKIGRMLALIAM